MITHKGQIWSIGLLWIVQTFIYVQGEIEVTCLNIGSTGCQTEGVKLKCCEVVLELKKVQSAVDCQQYCQLIDKCQAWNFDRSKQYCSLLNSNPTRTAKRTKYISGPKYCNDSATTAPPSSSIASTASLFPSMSVSTTQSPEQEPLVLIASDASRSQDVVVYDMSTDVAAPCKVLNNYPVPYNNDFFNTVAAYIANSVLICGGTKGGSIWFNDCNQLDIANNNNWTSVAPLKYAVYGAAAVAMNGKMYITGGLSSSQGRLNKVQIHDGTTVSEGLPLVDGVYAHCAVKVNETHFFATSGASGSKCFLYDVTAEEHPQTLLRSMRYNHRYGSCGLVKRSNGELEIVVAGAEYYRDADRNRTEIYSLKDNTWRNGPDLPLTLAHAASVQNGNTFYLIGGRTWPSFFYKSSKKILKFDPINYQWIELEKMLKNAVARHSAVVVPRGAGYC